MKCENLEWAPGTGLSHPATLGSSADLVFVFGERLLLNDGELLGSLKVLYPVGLIVGCTSAAEISDDQVTNNKVVITAVQFEKSKVSGAREFLSLDMNSYDAGLRLAKSLARDDLRHVLVLSVGLNVNGSELVRGLSSVLPREVGISGGLAGDQGRFEDTFVIYDGQILRDAIVGIGFYGDIDIKSAARGGWECFGEEKEVTKSLGNKLFELNGDSALQVYKSYLGKYSRGLPASALMFPLYLYQRGESTGVVRTILNTDLEEDSMTFAGDVPEKHLVRFMRADKQSLVEGAREAAQESLSSNHAQVDLVLAFSCVGRKIVLGPGVNEEIAAVRQVVGTAAFVSGFYTYGEIGPVGNQGPPVLHNQTMAITTFREE